MNKILKVGIIQQQNSSSIDDNRNRIADKIAELAKNGAQLIVNQELHDSLYFCQTESTDLCDLAVAIPSEATNFYAQLARENNVVIVTSLFERRAPGLYHNTAVVFEKDGSIAGKYRKMHIPDDPAYYEKFYFTPGDLGFEPINTSVGCLGVLVCWDQWYPEAARLMALRGAELLIYPTAIGTESTDTPDTKAATAISGVKFKVTRTDTLGTAGKLDETACSNIPIMSYSANVPEAYFLTASSYGSGSGWHGASITRQVGADKAGEVGATHFHFYSEICVGIGSYSSAKIN